MKMIGNVSDWLSYAGGALIKVADSAGSTVVCHKICCKRFENLSCCFMFQSTAMAMLGHGFHFMGLLPNIGMALSWHYIQNVH